jgi:hypothetical protein
MASSPVVERYLDRCVVPPGKSTVEVESAPNMEGEYANPF